MTDTLREKLEAILSQPGKGLNGSLEHEVNQIEQAFTEDGYLTPEERSQWHEQHFNGNHMTGPEWLARFEEEVGSWTHDAYSGSVETVMQAAKRAAGVE